MITLLLATFSVLFLATLLGLALRGRARTDAARATVANLNDRIRSWWGMCAVVLLAMLVGPVGSLVLFGLISFLGLREFMTLTPTRRADHAALCWCFFVFLPAQYVLVGVDWYGLFTIFIPVYVFLFLPIRIALTGDTTGFLERTAKIQWGMMAAVYCISHAPALMMLDIPGYSENLRLILYLIIVVQMSDVLQYVFGKLFGKHHIVPKVSPNKTVEGFVGGILAASLLGMALWKVTPFAPWEAFGVSLLICLLGFAGGLCMSAVKRDLGVKDFGAMIAGHGGMLDRTDSLCFAAPVFFHVLRYFYT